MAYETKAAVQRSHTASRTNTVEAQQKGNTLAVLQTEKREFS